jgi:hypothetical protein
MSIYSETGGHIQPSILKQHPDTLPLLLKNTNSALERQVKPVTCLANARAQLVESIRKLRLLALASSLALALALAPAAAVAVVDLSLKLVYGGLGVEDALRDLELATKRHVNHILTG